MTSPRYSIESPVDTSLSDGAELDHDLAHLVNGRKRFIRVDVVLLEMPRADISRLVGIYFLNPRLFEAIKDAGLTGLAQLDFSMSFDEQMLELGEFDGQELPYLVCVEVLGDVGSDDFAHVEGVVGLVVSERALGVLQNFDLTDCTISPYRRNRASR
jgi:hypothetical protein